MNLDDEHWEEWMKGKLLFGCVVGEKNLLSVKIKILKE